MFTLVKSSYSVLGAWLHLYKYHSELLQQFPTLTSPRLYLRVCKRFEEFRAVKDKMHNTRNPRMDFVIVSCDVCKFLRHGLSSGFYGHPVYSLMDLSELYIRSYLMMAAQYPCFAIYSLSLTSCSYRKASGNLTFWRSEALSKQKSFQFLPFYTSLLKM